MSPDAGMYIAKVLMAARLWHTGCTSLAAADMKSSRAPSIHVTSATD